MGRARRPCGPRAFFHSATAAYGSSKRRPADTCTLLTAEAEGLPAPCHDRMPVINRPGGYDQRPGADAGRAEAVTALLRPRTEGGWPHARWARQSTAPLTTTRGAPGL